MCDGCPGAVELPPFSNNSLFVVGAFGLQSSRKITRVFQWECFPLKTWSRSPQIIGGAFDGKRRCFLQKKDTRDTNRHEQLPKLVEAFEYSSSYVFPVEFLVQKLGEDKKSVANLFRPGFLVRIMSEFKMHELGPAVPKIVCWDVCRLWYACWHFCFMNVTPQRLWSPESSVNLFKQTVLGCICQTNDM